MQPSPQDAFNQSSASEGRANLPCFVDNLNEEQGSILLIIKAAFSKEQHLVPAGVRHQKISQKFLRAGSKSKGLPLLHFWACMSQRFEKGAEVLAARSAAGGTLRISEGYSWLKNVYGCQYVSAESQDGTLHCRHWSLAWRSLRMTLLKNP